MNDSNPITTDFTTIAGHRVRFAASRRTGAPQLLMTSPQPMSILTYGQMWDRLAERFDLLAVDLPNHGGSDAADEIVTVDEHGAFVEHVLDHFGLDRPHVVCPDIGTPTMLRFAADHPERLASIVGGDAGCVVPVEGELIFRLLVRSKAFGALLRSPGGAIGGRLYSRAANSIGYHRYDAPKAVLEDYRNGSTDRAKLRNQMGFLASYPSTVPALMDAYPTIDVPVLVLHGEYDTFVGMSNSERVAAMLPNSEFAVIPDAAHYSWEDNAEPYLAHILRWIERAEAAPRAG